MKGPTAEITTIDQYIAGFPKEVQALLAKVRATVRRAAPKAVERITYRIPTLYDNGNLVHFAAFKHHIGFYPTSSGIAAFQEELKPYKTSRGAVQFPIDQPLPLKLIGRITRFRVAEHARKGKAGRKKRS